jgi:thioredoxin reductase (NADPH)
MGGTDQLDTLMVDASEHPGGQAKYSSRIENFPGFPVGVTGEQLSHNMFDQAQRVGADTRMGVKVTSLKYDPETDLKTLTLSNGETVEAKSVIIAGGVEFRKAEFPGADSSSVIYGDPKALVEQSAGKPVVILGGSNGASQAALNAALTASSVTLIWAAESRQVSRSSCSSRIISRWSSSSALTRQPSGRGGTRGRSRSAQSLGIRDVVWCRSSRRGGRPRRPRT